MVKPLNMTIFQKNHRRRRINKIVKWLKSPDSPYTVVAVLIGVVEVAIAEMLSPGVLAMAL